MPHPLSYLGSRPREEVGSDRVVKGARARTGLGRFPVGSNFAARDATCPSVGLLVRGVALLLLLLLLLLRLDLILVIIVLALLLLF